MSEMPEPPAVGEPTPPAARKPKPGINPIPADAAFHQVLGSVRQLRFMETHSTALLTGLAERIVLTTGVAPAGRRGTKTYELRRGEKPDPKVRERMLEKLIWQQWGFRSSDPDRAFVEGVCRFVQSYQVPLQGKRADKGWGKIDLIGATPEALPAVIELKQEGAKDTPLRMLAEALAYACAVRVAWQAGRFRDEWVAAMTENGLAVEPPATLDRVPLLLLAPGDFWHRAIGTPGVRTEGKVPVGAWSAFRRLADECGVHGFPTHCVRFDMKIAEDTGIETVTDIGLVTLPDEAS